MSAPALPLPGLTPPVLRDAYQGLSPERREAFFEHLMASTSSEYLSDWLARAGSPVGATTIKRYRRAVLANE